MNPKIRKFVSLVMSVIYIGAIYILFITVEWGCEHYIPFKPENLDSVISNTRIVLLWFGMTLFLIRLVEFISSLFNSVRSTASIKLLQDISIILVWFFSVLFLLVIVYNQSISSLVAASSVTIAIIGFSIRTILLDLVSGVAMGLEKPFSIGDWIAYGNETGQVIQTNWRVTRIVTRDGVEVIIPNSMLALESFMNYNQPQRHFRVTVDIALDHMVDREKVENLLLSAANKVETVRKAPKKADVKIKEITMEGIIWSVRFWIDSYEQKDYIVYDVESNVLKNMKYASIPMLGPKRNIHIQRVKEENRKEQLIVLLQRIQLFRMLPFEDLIYLAEEMIEKRYEKEQIVTNQGDAGDSVFVVAEGLLSVELEQSNPNLEVALLSAGDFFGEMSLLLGEPRSATIRTKKSTLCYELKRELFTHLAEKNPDLIQELSILLAERKVHNKKMIDNVEQNGIAEAQRVEEKQIFLKIRSLFMA